MVTLSPDGSPLFALGDVTVPVFPRSSSKPLQVVGMLRAGLPLQSADLALAAASHSGEEKHVSRVRELLHRAGLPESALGCPPSLPLSEEAAAAVIRAGGGPSRVQMNCSGKHAAMLLTCVAADWPTEGYLDAEHPLQKTLRAAAEDLSGETIEAVGVDGCGAPVFAMSLTGLARCYSGLVLAEPGTPERAVADAMRQYPDIVGGTDRDVTRLMGDLPGLLTKDGAEGVFAAATASGAAVALKIDDGAARARTPVLVQELRRLGVEGPALDELGEMPVLGGGKQVGSVRAAY